MAPASVAEASAAHYTMDDVAQHDSADSCWLVISGVVYDVTEFAQHHPGGRDLLLTAAGLDLDHFFGNYAVHGLTPKAAQWLAPLAVGRLTEADALRARELSNPEAHVERRMTLLGGARRKIVLIAATLPFWMAIRGAVRLVGWAVPPLGRLLAWALPVAVPSDD